MPPMWLFKHYLNGTVTSIITARVALPTETARAQEWCSISYSAIVNSFQAICNLWKYFDTWWRQLYLQVSKYEGSRPCSAALYLDALMPIHLYEVGVKRACRRRHEQVDMLNTLSMVARAAVGIKRRLDAEGGIVYSPSRKQDADQ